MSEANGLAFRAGVQTIPGMLVTLTAGTGLVLLVFAVSQERLASSDHGLLTAFAALRGPIPDGFFQVMTWLGSGYVLVPTTITLLMLLAASRQWGAAWLMGITYFGASLSTWGLKLVIERERPTLYPSLEGMLRMDWSFPSGHTTHAAAFALGLWLMMRATHPRWSALAGFTLLGLVLLVAASRLHLQVHWPSDVLAGLLVATLWAGLAVMLARFGMATGRAG